ncbi:MAG: thiamine-monophosphate kinase [Candidatus Binatia bacterium]|nr:MAG: thiamine-monophosphate kinase [Candidatus Binatia bacterium]
MLSKSRRARGEFAFLRSLFAKLPSAPDVVFGPGHDAARVRSGRRDWLLTVDSQFEGVHFKLPWLPMSALGRRSFRVAASDVSAMGGKARFVLLDCGVPEYVRLQALRRLEIALAREAKAWGACVIGGNLHRAAELGLSVTVVAEAPKTQLSRQGARLGDLVLVTGTLGDASLCVRLLTSRGACPPLLLRRWRLPPRRDEIGRGLANARLASAMIDVSDGLVQDLGHICEASQVGAEVDADRLPVSSMYRKFCGSDLSLALSGGEDYELLFTAPPRNLGRIKKLGSATGVEVTVIGRIVQGQGVVVRQGQGRLAVKQPGFDHFTPL